MNENLAWLVAWAREWIGPVAGFAPAVAVLAFTVVTTRRRRSRRYSHRRRRRWQVRYG